MKNKLVRNICIAAVSIGVLGGGYWLAVKWQPEGAEEKREESKPEETVKLFTCNSDEIASVKAAADGYSYTVEHSGGGYRIAEKPDIQYDKSKLGSVFSKCADISAAAVITNDMQRAAEFGLDGDETVTVTLKSGEQHIFILGSVCAGDGNRYICESGAEQIYTVGSEFSELTQKKTYDFCSTDIDLISAEAVRGFSVYRDNALFIKTELLSEADGQSFTSDYKLTYPYRGPVKQDVMSEIIQDFSQLSIVRACDDMPQALGVYGLDRAKTIVFSTDSGELTYKFGNRIDNESVYMQCGGQDTVYEVGSKAYDDLEKLMPMDMIMKFIQIFSIDKVSSVRLDAPQGTYTMEPGGEDKDFLINGSVCDEKEFKKIYQQVIGLQFSEFTDASPSGEPAYTVTFTFDDGTQDTARYYSYDNKYMLAENNGNKYLVSTGDIDAAFKELMQR